MKKYVNVFLFLIVLMLFVIYINHRANKYKELLKSDGKFTIGTTDGVAGNVNIPSLTFHFTINGKTFHSEAPVRDKKGLGNQFYVVYHMSDPSKGRLLLYYPVPKSIKGAPKDGWKTMPEVDYSLRDSLNLDIYKEESNENLKEREWK